MYHTIVCLPHHSTLLILLCVFYSFYCFLCSTVTKLATLITLSTYYTNYRFALQLLAPHNSAITPVVDEDLTQPLAHYWAACSHNSYIIGDQLTGESSAEMYRRVLLQVGFYF